MTEQPTAPCPAPPESTVRGAGTLPTAPRTPRSAAWSRRVVRLRTLATTEPGRLRVIGGMLASLMLTFGAISAWEASARTAASGAVVDRSQPWSADAAGIYRSLADANSTAAGGFLAGGDEPRLVRDRYEQDIRTASRLIIQAAYTSQGTVAQRRLERLTEELTVYTGLVETARANNRQGLPVGGAYLRYANERMQHELLPTARSLHDAQTAQLDEDYRAALAWPWLSFAVGGLTLGALCWSQRRHYLRTHRVFNLGLLTGTAATTALLVWLVVGHSVASLRLSESDQHGAQSLHTLNEALISSLAVRGDESMTLVAHGAGSGYERGYQRGMTRLAGPASTRSGGLLARALELADDETGRQPVRSALRNAQFWRDRHRDVREFERKGDYNAAVAMVIGSQGTTGETFDRVNAGVRQAMRHEQREFGRAASAGYRALGGLPEGAGALALLGAAGTVLGVGRRLSEYR